MKKLIVILAMVALAATPVLASVTMTVAKVGTTYNATVSYAVSDPCTVRAFALDITANNSKTITAVTCSNSSYYIYPGSISIVGGSVSTYGSCVCDASKYVGTQPGTGTSGVTVEMGSLYTGGAKPATSGTLLTFTVSGDCTATVNVNSARGGIVMENPDEAPGHNLAQTVIWAPSTCYTGANGAQWALVESPTCWCKTYNPRQCYGDADNNKEQKANYWVYSNDFTILLAAWAKPYTSIKNTTAGTGAGVKAICADFNQNPEQKASYRVYSSDFNILLANWAKANLPAATCP